MTKVTCKCGWEYVKVDDEFLNYLRQETNELTEYSNYWRNTNDCWAFYQDMEGGGYQWYLAKNSCRNRKCPTND